MTAAAPWLRNEPVPDWRRATVAELAEAQAYGKAQQQWAHEWRDKCDALAAAARKVTCATCDGEVWLDDCEWMPCPDCADLRALLGGE